MWLKIRSRADAEQMVSQKGSVLTELTITMPILVAVIIGITDLGRAINTYAILNQIAREASRVASDMEELEPGTFVHIARATSETHCDPPGLTSTDSCFNHLVVQRRVMHMVSWTRLETQPESIRVTTELVGEDGSDIENTISVVIEGSFDGLFPLFDGLPIRAVVRSPYLYTVSGTAMNVGCPEGSTSASCQMF
jgi:hypothetical protein